MLDALILSGGDLERERFPDLPPEIERKAQIPILGQRMVDWTVAALRACPAVDRIVVVGHPTLASPELDRLQAALIPERGEIGENVRAGLEALTGARRVLALSGDLPLLTRAGVEDLLENAPEAELVFPFVERAEIMRAFPEREWVFVKTAEGRFTGCSAALIQADALLDRWEWVDRVLAARRQHLRLAAMFGVLFLLKLRLGRLRLAEAERRVSRVLRVDARGYRTAFTELALDVDKQGDLAEAEAILRRRGAP